MGKRDLSSGLVSTWLHHRNPLSPRVQPYFSKSHLKEEKPREAPAWKSHNISGFHPFLICRPPIFSSGTVASCTMRNPAVTAALLCTGAPALGIGWPEQAQGDNVEDSPEEEA